MKKKFAIISGEPNSINSEIIAKSWIRLNKKLRSKFFVIGNFEILKKQLNKIRIKIPIIKLNNFNEIKQTKSLQVLDIPLKFKNPFEVSKKNNSNYIKQSLNLAHKLALNKDIYGFINCSVDKRSLGKNNLGVTEYLSKKNKLMNSEVMMIYNKNLSVVPLTTHVNIKDINKKLKFKFIEKKINTLNSYYSRLFKKKPTIAVLGLNPHNAELKANSEEKKIILPLVKKLKRKKIKIFGPFSADTIFIDQNNKFDVIIGMYHDQVLAPFKALFGFDAINITLGLKYIRISPDHGTAKDIINKRKANPKSLLEAIIFISKIK